MTGFHHAFHRLPLAIACLLLAACSPQAPGNGSAKPVWVQRVSARPAGDVMAFSGEVRARHEVDLAFRVGGKIASRLVDAGARVKAGAVLARLDPADLKLAEQATRAQLAAAESDAATARAERDRYAGLLAQKFVSQAAFDARDNIARAAAARLLQARAQSAASGNQLAYGNLMAMHDGIITMVLAEAGQVVAAGQPVMRLAQPEEMEVAIAVPESRISGFRNADTFAITFWAAPGLQLQGRLRELAPAADPITRTYAARIRITDPAAVVQLGMTARVHVTAHGEPGQMVIPASALVDQGTGPAVWQVIDGRLKRRPVTVARFREDGVVLASGLQGGETIVAVGAHRLAEGQAVKPQDLPEHRQ